MKRALQLVVLMVVALVAAQPVSAYAACGQQACAGDGCAPVCCDSMTGMSHGGGAQWAAGCQAPMDASPAGVSCGQAVPPVVVVIAKDLSAVSGGPSATAVTAHAQRVEPMLQELSWGSLVSSSREIAGASPDKTILLQTFRI